MATQTRIEARVMELKEHYGERDPDLEDFAAQVRRSRDILLTKHATNPAKIRGHGFIMIGAVAPVPKTGGVKPPKP